MDAALAPLCLQGIRVLNYLDDWLILAHSMAAIHRDVVLAHMREASEKFLTLKTALLLSLASLRRIGDLQTLLVAPTCLKFAPGICPKGAPALPSQSIYDLCPPSRLMACWHSHPRSRGHVSSNLIYPPLLSQSQTVVVGGLWNCQSAGRKTDFISALASHYSFDFLALTETWISPQNTAIPAALSSAYAFSHSPRESGRGGGTVSVTSPINLFIIVIYRPPGPLGDFLEEMDTLLSVFPSHSTPLMVLGDLNLPSDKLHSSGLLALLNSISLSFNSCPPTHKGGNVLDLVFTHPSPATDMTATPPHISDHHLVPFTITLHIQPKRNSQHLSLTRQNLHSISRSSIASCTLSPLPGHDSFSSLPLDSATDTFLSSLSSTFFSALCPLYAGRILLLLLGCQTCFAIIGENYDQQRGSGRNLNLTQISSLIVHFGRDFCQDLLLQGKA
ncbi:hypothetical protein QTP70_017759 [Hemibagrus guttatus]|uniref:Endonuclease/exonuclease/phosphatase domain-containing protein n=1 Tax=Hemibagrus guttatus TaxID=175788 RepID=A0AAE0V093_9TELE|nr:hypothetical protein QTP70_017759 [Hemibagrus guttatus]